MYLSLYHSTLPNLESLLTTFRYPVRYHPSEQKPQVYHPIPVPFELPNKEIQEEKYYLKQYEGNNYPSAEEVSGRIDWPLYLDSFERLPSDLNNLLPHSGYDYESPSFQYYGSSEVGRRLVRALADKDKNNVRR